MDELSTPLSPMSVTSQVTESHNPRVPAQKILDDIEQKFGKAKTKSDVINALERCSYLHRIPLPPPNVGLEQAGKDFCRERVLLNDVAFVPDRYDVDRSHAFALTLRMLVKRLTRVGGCFDETLYHDSNNICDLLMQRACRTSAGADSFFTVQKMLCVEGTFVTQKSLVDDPPIHIDVFLSNTNVYPFNNLGNIICNSNMMQHQQGLLLPTSIDSPPCHAEIRRRTHSGNFRTLNTTSFSSTSHSNNGIIHSRQIKEDVKFESESGRQLASLSAPPEYHSFSVTDHVQDVRNIQSQSTNSETIHSKTMNNVDDRNVASGNLPLSLLHTPSPTSSDSPSLCARIQVSNSFAIYDVSAMDLLGETDTDNFFNDDISGYDTDGIATNSSDYANADINNETGVSAGDGMFHKSNSNPNNLGDTSNSRAPRPWLDVESVVVDESNFKTGRHWRRLHLLITCVATGQTFSSDHYSTFQNHHKQHHNSHSSGNSIKHRSLSQSHSDSHIAQNARAVNARAVKALSTNIDEYSDDRNMDASHCHDVDFCSDADDDLFYGPRSHRHSDHSMHSGRLSGRRVFRELAAWLSASSAAAAERLSGGQRSQQSHQTLNTVNTQHSSSHFSHTPVPHLLPVNNDHEVSEHITNITDHRQNSTTSIDIAHRGLPSLPFLSHAENR